MSAALLHALAAALNSGGVRVIDLTQTLRPDFPTISMPPELGQSRPFRMEEISRYDARGPAWYWNNISVGEHAGTHFDAPVHWVSGRDRPGSSTDTPPPSCPRPAGWTARWKPRRTPTSCSPRRSCTPGSHGTAAFPREAGC